MGNCLPPRFINPNSEIVPGAPTRRRWYHGNIDHDEAEERLTKAAREDGNYLVYDYYANQRARPVPGNYILLVYYPINGGNVLRWKISRRQSDGRFILGKDNARMVKSYASVRELIRAHRGIRGKPLMLPKGQRVKLTLACIRRPTNTLYGFS